MLQVQQSLLIGRWTKWWRSLTVATSNPRFPDIRGLRIAFVFVVSCLGLKTWLTITMSDVNFMFDQNYNQNCGTKTPANVGHIVPRYDGHLATCRLRVISTWKTWPATRNSSKPPFSHRQRPETSPHAEHDPLPKQHILGGGLGNWAICIYIYISAEKRVRRK